MPLLPIFNELKGFANSINPLNVFADQTNDNTQNAAKSPSAVAGPGPSTQASAAYQNRSSTLNIPEAHPRPIRPSLRNGGTSSISSFEEDGRRRSSGASVVILDPTDDAERRTRRAEARENGTARRKPRPASVGTGIVSANGDHAPRRRKAPLDTYIIVRPPPTSSKNPLNLQIQLVVKDVKQRDRSVSGVSLNSASMSADMTSTSAPVTPSTPNIELPIASSESGSHGELSSSEESKPRSDSPAAISSDEADQDKIVGSALQRTSSLKSNLSSTTTSTTLSRGGKKRVEPMFNLAVHHVMQPTVVTDAATDVKVAKFLKRALDISGVGILEPSEVRLPPSQTPSSANLAVTSSNEDTPQSTGRRPVSFVSLTSPLSPTVTRASDNGAANNIRNSLDLSIKKTSIELKNLRMEVGQEGGAKKFFGKMFKKRQQADSPSPAVQPRRKSISTTRRSPSPSSSNGDTVVGGQHVKGILQNNGTEQSMFSGHPTFGTAPIIVHRRSSGTIVTADGAVTGLTAPHTPSPSPGLSISPPGVSYLDSKCTNLPMVPSNRPIGYTWTVKKWARKNSEGWAAHLVAAAAAGIDMMNGPITGDGDEEVVFEWVKLRLPGNAVGSNIMRTYSNTGALAPAPSKNAVRPRKPKSRTASIREDTSPVVEIDSTKVNQTHLTPDVQPASLPPSPNLGGIDPRPSAVRRVSAGVSPSRRGSSSPPSINASDGDEQDSSSVHTYDMTAEEDSDPEDSETPWVCSVWVKKTGHRQLLGTLTPALHHPKVIAALKIPRCLDSVSLTEVKEGSSPAQAEMASKVKKEVCLTEENLKDVVCVTAMWLVAREEFGGLGRKKRHSRV